MKHWTVHLIVRVLAILVTLTVLVFLFSGDGGSDAMGNGMAAGFAIFFAYAVSLLAVLIFLGVESVRLFRKDETAKAICNIVIIAAMAIVPIVVLLEN